MISIVLLLLLSSVVRGDISEKLRQGQGLAGRPSNFQGLQPPLFGGGVKGGGVAQRAPGATNPGRIVIPSHHGDENDEDNLERLCNDPFHSFLCKPVGPRKYRLDGNLRPGAVLPPGMYFGASSNVRESKEPLTMGGALLPSEIDPGYQYPKPSPTPGYSYPAPIQQNIPQASNQNFQQGYKYDKPSNPFPLPSQQITTKAPPPGPAYQYLPALEPQKPQIDVRFRPSNQNIQSLPQRFSFSNVIPKATNNAPQQIPYRPSTPFPTLRTTLKPFTTPKPYTYKQPTFPTTQKSFFFQAKSSQVVTTSAPAYLPPFQTQKPKFPTNQNSLNAPQATNVIKSTALPKPSNQYLPSFGQDSKPTNQFTVTTRPKPSNEYLPAETREGQSTNIQPNIEGGALLPDEIDPKPSLQRPLKKHERNHTLEELCSEAFHSFLCKPITKTRKRIDGNIRPGAKIPPHVLLGASAGQNSRRLLPNQEGQAILPSEIDPASHTNHNGYPGYQYQVPQTSFDSTNVRNEYVFPNQFAQQFFIGAASDSLSLAKQFNNRNSLSTQTFAPDETTLTTELSVTQTPDESNTVDQDIPTTTDKGYYYPKPSSTLKPIVAAGSNQIDNGYYYPKPASTEKPKQTNVYNYSKTTKGLSTQKDNGYYYTKPSTLEPAGSSQTEEKGYFYPKPNVPNKPAASNQQNGYYYPKPTTRAPTTTTQRTSTTTTPTTTTTTSTTAKPEPVLVPQGTSNDESKGYHYPKPSDTFTLPTKKPNGYTYSKPPKGREFTLPNFTPKSSSLPFGARLQAKQGQYQVQEKVAFPDLRSFQTEQTKDDNDLPPASQFEILKP